MKLLHRLAAVCLLAAAIVLPASANIVTNGGFESSTTGWTTTAWNTYSRGVQSGQLAAGTGCTQTNFTCTIGQSLATVAGQRYDLTFWLYTDGYVNAGGEVVGQFSNGLRVWFGGDIVETIIDFPTTNTGGTWLPGGPPTLITISNLLATSSSTLLQFAGYHLPAGIFIDDVTVEAAVNAVPEPGSLALLGATLGALLIARRRADGGQR